MSGFYYGKKKHTCSMYLRELRHPHIYIIEMGRRQVLTLWEKGHGDHRHTSNTHSH
jgi:hypothetical protein